MRNLKKILALALALVMTLSVMTVANAAFTDSSSVDATYAEAVDVLTGIGVFKGTSTTTFSPKQSITRAEVAAIIYRIVTGDVTDKQAGIYADYAKFNDVKSTAWYAGYVGYCSNANLIKGDGKGNFLPTATVTGYQALAMILRAMGYDVNGEFTGTGWEVKVASTAQQRDILVNVNAGTLGTPATREVVAELLFQAIQKNTVIYTPALGYYTADLYGNQTAVTSLAEKNFGLAKTSTTKDEWGRPSYKWTATKPASVKGTVATIAQTPVLTYTVAVDGCTLLKDLGYAENKTTVVTFNTYTDGISAGHTATVQSSHNNTTACLAKSHTYGAQGRLMEVYATDVANTYTVVYVDTYLALIGNTTKAKTSHDTYDTVALTVYEANATGTSKTYSYLTGTASYTKGNYALVTMADGIVKSVAETAPVATSVMTGFNATTTTVGSAYSNACKFFVGKPAALTDVNKTYSVYVDTYGNVIGLTVPNTAYNYGIITDIAWQNSWGLADEYIMANLVDMNGAVASNVTIGNKWNNAYYNIGNFASVDSAAVGYNKSGNTAFYGHLFQFYVDAAGRYVASAVGNDVENVNITTNSPYIGSLITNDNTAYLVKTMVNGQAVYTPYTGYKSVPTIKGANICYVLNSAGSYVQYVYVDATAASFAGTSELAVITDANVDAYAALYGYDMYVGTDKVTKYVAANGTTAKTLAEVGYDGAGLYAVAYDATGNITGLTHIMCDGRDQVVKTTQINATYNDGTVIRDAAGNAYNCTDAAIYLGNLTAGTVVAGDTASTVGATCYMILGTNNVVTAIYIWVG